MSLYCPALNKHERGTSQTQRFPSTGDFSDSLTGIVSAQEKRSVGLTRGLQCRKVSELGGKYEKVIVRGFADVRSWRCGVRAAARTGHSEFPEDQHRLLHRRP